MADGGRRAVKIAEVTGLQGDTILTQDLFEFRQTGINADNQVQGHFTATGCVPTFLDRFQKTHIKLLLQSEGIDLPLSLFKPQP